MTLHAIGVVYDLTDLCDWEGVGLYFEITQGLNDPPQVRGVDVVVPGADGRVPRPRRVDVHKIVLLGHVRGLGVDQETSRTLFRANVQTLRVLFANDRDPAVLEVTLEDGTTATINARPTSSIWDEKVISEYANVSVELESVDPDWNWAGS